MPTLANDVDLIRTHGHTSAEQRALQRRVHRGELVRIRAGVLADTATVAGLDARGRYRVLVRAALPYVPAGAAISHLSAAVVLDWPHIGSWPHHVHLIDPDATRNRTTRWFVVHAGAQDPPPVGMHLDGVPVVEPTRTVVDLARTRPLAESVPIIDHAMRSLGLTHAELHEALVSGGPRGLRRAGRAIELGSPLSDSPAESLCRVRLIEVGAPVPVQQHRFSRPGSRTAIVDFWFPDQGVVLEVDGRGKYEDPDMLRGRSVADAHWAEKRREDFVRSFPEVRTVIRLAWSDLMSPERIRAALRRAGVPCR